MTHYDIVRVNVKGQEQYIPNHARMTRSLRHEIGLKRGIDKKNKEWRNPPQGYDELARSVKQFIRLAKRNDEIWLRIETKSDPKGFF